MNLLTGGLLVRVQPEELNFSTTYRHAQTRTIRCAVFVASEIATSGVISLGIAVVDVAFQSRMPSTDDLA